MNMGNLALFMANLLFSYSALFSKWHSWKNQLVTSTSLGLILLFYTKQIKKIGFCKEVTSQTPGVAGDEIWKPQEIQLHIRRRVPGALKVSFLKSLIYTVLKALIHSHSSLSHFYMSLKTWILKSLYNLDLFPSRKGAKQPADKCNFGSKENLLLPAPKGVLFSP